MGGRGREKPAHGEPSQIVKDWTCNVSSLFQRLIRHTEKKQNHGLVSINNRQCSRCHYRGQIKSLRITNLILEKFQKELAGQG